MSIINQKSIPFYIKTTNLANGALRAYEGCIARTVPFDQCSTILRDGEITVSMISRISKNSCHNSMYLVPLVPLTIVSGILLGVVKVDKAKQDQMLEDKDLALLEDFTLYGFFWDFASHMLKQ
ncbi:hypothetical protein V8E53_010834 [Lactarius tabidus]